MGCIEAKCYDELLEYKQIEQELGIDLITLFEALKNGIWYQDDDEEPIIHIETKFLYINRFDYGNNVYEYFFYVEIPNDMEIDKIPFTDYGKTWALSKEELKK